MLVFAQVSSMKMRRDGSSAGCVSSHAARDAATSGTILLDRCQWSFFERDLVGFQETPDRADFAARHPTLLMQPGLHRMQGQIILRRDQCQQQAASSSLIRVLVAPPIGLAAAVPVSSQPDAASSRTVETLTAKREAAVRHSHPPEWLRSHASANPGELGSSRSMLAPFTSHQSMNHKSLPKESRVRFSLARNGLSVICTKVTDFF